MEPEHPRLALITFTTARPSSQLEELLPTLPETSRVRAERYRSADARANLICSHAVLRQTLLALGESPGALLQADNGRPHLAGSRVEFNLSHSHERGVLIVGRDESLNFCLGVDLEWVGRSLDFERLARRFFTAQEIELIGDDVNLFYWVWTRKEAVLKSSGLGLRKALDSFDVLDDEVSAEATGRRLQIETVRLPGGYVLSWALPYLGTPYHFSPSLLFLNEADHRWAHRLREHLPI